MRLALILATLLLCAGCGSGDAEPAAATGSGKPGGGNVSTELGSRGLPGYTVRILSIAPIIAGGSLAVEVQLTSYSSQAAPALIEAAVGVEEPAVWTAAVVKPGAASTWTWSGPLPGDLSGLRAWVRVSDAEGNVSQSGGQDFALGQ